MSLSSHLKPFYSQTPHGIIIPQLIKEMILQFYKLASVTSSSQPISIVALNIALFCGNIATILSDTLAFIGTIYQVWGIWKSKRRLGLQSNHKKDLVTSIFEQASYFSLQPLQPYWGLFSTLLICEFTLALRRRNTKQPTLNLSDIQLPTLSLPSQDDPARTQRSVPERLHESLVAEMAEPDPAGNPNSGEPNIDYLKVTSSNNVNPTNNAI
ncbi:hypothetical protein Clacol_000188 [Clathrus columnatus]|uniref:Uncharacterized protein n=1 Tax=Clathrus columnatus TaxID=1419009 RepID=A0AAV4ZWA6_9AGAM|nr:hypothetical protein Clacol_000188 [Clathrus columnatus]